MRTRKYTQTYYYARAHFLFPLTRRLRCMLRRTLRCTLRRVLRSCCDRAATHAAMLAPTHAPTHAARKLRSCCDTLSDACCGAYCETRCDARCNAHCDTRCDECCDCDLGAITLRPALRCVLRRMLCASCDHAATRFRTHAAAHAVRHVACNRYNGSVMSATLELHLVQILL